MGDLDKLIVARLAQSPINRPIWSHCYILACLLTYIAIYDLHRLGTKFNTYFATKLQPELQFGFIWTPNRSARDWKLKILLFFLLLSNLRFEELLNYKCRLNMPFQSRFSLLRTMQFIVTIAIGIGTMPENTLLLQCN